MAALTKKQLRGLFAGRLEEHAEEAWQLLWEVAHANRTYKTKCQCSRWVEVEGPDGNQRTKALELLANQAYGRPKETIEHSGTITHKPLDQLTDDDLNKLLDSSQNVSGP